MSALPAGYRAAGANECGKALHTALKCYEC